MKHKRLVSMIGILVVLTCTIVMMTSCQHNIAGKIEGVTWKMTKPGNPAGSITLMLKERKAVSTITLDIAGITSSNKKEGTYKIAGNKLTLNLPLDSGFVSGEYECTVSGNTMKLSKNGVSVYEFERQ